MIFQGKSQNHVRHGLIYSLDSISNCKLIHDFEGWLVKIDFPGIGLQGNEKASQRIESMKYRAIQTNIRI